VQPRFVSSYLDFSVPDSVATDIPFTSVITNDVSGESGYRTAIGSSIGAPDFDTFSGDHFAGVAGDDQAFRIKQVAGLYLLQAGIEMYVPTTQVVTVRVYLPSDTGAGGFGASPFQVAGSYWEDVEFGRFHLGLVTVLLIDISNNNAVTPTAFPLLKAARIEGAWLKSSEGRTFDDRFFSAAGAARGARRAAGGRVPLREPRLEHAGGGGPPLPQRVPRPRRPPRVEGGARHGTAR
jgi:hypothetical protein